MARTGRRPGESGARGAILDAARGRFASDGYDAATIRGIAHDAGVDPALVHHYFGTKQRLFTAAMDVPFDPAAYLSMVLSGGLDGIGERLARAFLDLWDQPEGGGHLIALLRSAVTQERAATMVREFLSGAILAPVAAELGRPDADLRTDLVASQLLGLVMARAILRLEPLASTDREVVAAAIAPTLQRYLTGPV